MILGISYIVFDGIELLEYSISQIRQHVNYINVVYQDVSWFGKKMSASDSLILKSLVEKKLIDELIPFSAFTVLTNKNTQSILRAKEYERKKRQLGLSFCLKRGCTHFLGMDVDEFYDTALFEYAKLEILKNKYDSTCVRFINYVNLPILHRGYDPSRVPFICKINSSTKMGRNFFVRCDPTRGIINGAKKKHEFTPSSIVMHHMETVRKDLNLKYESTTRGVFQRSRIRELISKINGVTPTTKTFDFNKIIFPAITGVKLTLCSNKFNIPYETWKK